MRILAIKTRILNPPKDNLYEVLDTVVPKLKPDSIVAVSSKIVSIGEGNTTPLDRYPDKDKLVIQEAEKYLPREFVPGGWVMHTIKNNLLIPTAGIDESNSDDYFVLWPKDPEKSAQKIWKYLKEKSGVKNLGVIITDSHSVPGRRGIVGLSLGFFGFKPLRDYRGQKDLFGKELRVSQTNNPDSLATAAVFVIGEGAEQTPIALITDLDDSIEFIDRRYTSKGHFNSLIVPLEEDLYYPFISSVPWKKGKAK